MERIVSLGGIGIILLVAYLLSASKKHISKRVVLWGLFLQLIFTLLVLGVPFLKIPGAFNFLFRWANDFFLAVLDYTNQGSIFLFGPLMDEQKAQGFIFAVKILPSIIFFSSLMAVGYYLGIMQKVVLALSWLMQKTMKTSGAETLSTAANIFVGQTEAPLMIRPYVQAMTKSELFTVMAGGMANTAGGVLVAYVAILQKYIPDIAGHLLTVSVLTAPSAIVITKIMFPETETPATAGKLNLEAEQVPDANIIEAASRGAAEGLVLAMNVAAMLLAFIALVAMVNNIFSWFGVLIHFPSWGKVYVPEVLLQNGEAILSLQVIFGWLMAPFAWIMGVPWNEAPLVGALLGEKTTLNEFVAYLHLANIGEKLSERSFVIASYALCGFANFSSIAIQIGGIGGMAPERRSDVATLGVKALIAGTLSTFLATCFAAIVL